jgi:glutathione S-transferase
MAEPQLVLWGDSRFESPYVFSSFVALGEKGLPFELRLFSLDAGEHRKGDYPSRSITGRVPALQHGEFWLAESSAIDEYLEDVFPPPRHPRLYPQHPAARARARQVQAWLRSDLMPLRDERPTSTVFSRRPVKPLTAAGQASAARVVAAAESLLPPGASHLFGEFSIADVDLALMLQRLVANGDAVPDRVKAFAAAVWQRPSVQEWLSKPRPA